MEDCKSSIAIYNKVEEVLRRLYLCTEQEQIEDVFNKYEIKSFKERSDFLKKRMGILETTGTPDDTSEKEDYEFDCAVFIDGTWRLVH